MGGLICNNPINDSKRTVELGANEKDFNKFNKNVPSYFTSSTTIDVHHFWKLLLCC